MTKAIGSTERYSNSIKQEQSTNEINDSYIQIQKASDVTMFFNHHQSPITQISLSSLSSTKYLVVSPFTMKLSVFLLVACATSSAAFVPASLKKRTAFVPLQGYLDDLSSELYGPDSNPDVEAESREATKLEKEKQDRYGVGDWSSFVDFEEFDGGDGQMGVAGDGKKGLDKEWQGESQMAKSKFRSAKNAWGHATGYADQLRDKGVETSRAQQLENWHNQQQVLQERKQHKYMTEEFDQVEVRLFHILHFESRQTFTLSVSFSQSFISHSFNSKTRTGETSASLAWNVIR